MEWRNFNASILERDLRSSAFLTGLSFYRSFNTSVTINREIDSGKVDYIPRINYVGTV
jgi:hypothetical protein